jgi:hypothetical protein
VKPAFIFAVAAIRPSADLSEHMQLFRAKVQETFHGFPNRWRGHVSAVKERARDLFGCLLGRAKLAPWFFDPSMDGGYRPANQAAPGQDKRPVLGARRND